jgi:hypothetical protein
MQGKVQLASRIQVNGYSSALLANASRNLGYSLGFSSWHTKTAQTLASVPWLS